MKEDIIRMHLAAGRYYGRASTCGKKQAHVTEEDAQKAADNLNRSGKARHAVEPYPCYFCSDLDMGDLKWHIGRQMDILEILLFMDKSSEILEMEDILLSVAEPTLGMQVGERTLRVHNRKVCEGQFCCIHNPSDHHMKSWPMNWRGDRGIMERMCPHGIGHIDPDDSDYRKRRDGEESYDPGVHGCDGCCRSPAVQQGV